MNRQLVENFMEEFDSRILAATMLLNDGDFKRCIGVRREIYNFVFNELRPWPPVPELQFDFSPQVKVSKLFPTTRILETM